ncbi:Cadherin-1 [Gossypium arboreum]|uniref:Cadherin-1 n=1 Tax=Gossypium arboreum TaxID=29729 RepID=A0A0B0NHJ2_GOSAR|nr:Cadherin-1 [Gossypium arboreum]
MRANLSRTKENGIRPGKVESCREVDFVRSNSYEILKLSGARGSSRIITTLSNYILVPFENVYIEV